MNRGPFFNISSTALRTYYVLCTQPLITCYSEQQHPERGCPKASLPHWPQHLQQEARKGRGLPHQAWLPGELPSARGQVSHHSKGPLQADDRPLPWKPPIRLQHGRPRVLRQWTRLCRLRGDEQIEIHQSMHFQEKHPFSAKFWIEGYLKSGHPKENPVKITVCFTDTLKLYCT